MENIIIEMIELYEQNKQDLSGFNKDFRIVYGNNDDQEGLIFRIIPINGEDWIVENEFE